MNYVDHTASPPDVVALYELLKNGHTFTAVFEKRTNGEIRTMNARLGVKKHLAGGELKFSPLKRDLLPVFDMNIQEYRFIPMEGLISINVDGTHIQFRKPKDKPETNGGH